MRSSQLVQMQGKQGVRGFRLPVGQPFVVAPRELHIVPAHVGLMVSGGRDGDHARRCGAPARAGWPARNGPGGWWRTGLPSPARRGSRGSHDAAPQISMSTCCPPARKRRAKSRTLSSLARSSGSTWTLAMSRVCARAASASRDARAGLGQRAGGFQSQAGVAAGDDGGGVGQVQAGEHRLRWWRRRNRSRSETADGAWQILVSLGMSGWNPCTAFCALDLRL